jgi:pimeloyl-ACP methyl ester carboxylesterase
MPAIAATASQAGLGQTASGVACGRLAAPMAEVASPPDLAAPASVARVDGADLWYWDTGGVGQALILAHPSTGSGHIWGYQQAAFAAAGFRVIGYSRRGHLGSSAIDPEQPGTSAGDLRQLMDHLGIERAHLMGTAAGGFTAASFALEWSERVLTLTLACTLLSGADSRVLALMPSVRQPFWADLPHEFRELSPSYRGINKDGEALWKALYERSRGDHPADNQPAGIPATVDAISRFTMPVLFLTGDADLITPPPVARLFHNAVAGSELVMFTECGHSAYWERPDQFNEAILDFIARRSPLNV